MTGDAVKRERVRKKKECFGNNALLNYRDCKAEGVEIGKKSHLAGKHYRRFFTCIA